MIENADEALRSGALAHAMDLVRKLAGSAFEEAGAILGDNVRVYRVKNLIRTTEKTKRMLADAGLQPNPVSSRFLLPLLETCSVEDDDFLQERWAGLLASASQETDDLSPSFIDTLKQLKPKEAKHLDSVFQGLARLYKRDPTPHDSVPYQCFGDAWKAPKGAGETFERLGLTQRDYMVKLEQTKTRIAFEDDGKMESTLGDLDDAVGNLEAEVMHQYRFTAYALDFLKACRGPVK